jgi:hypothetical protein
MRESADGSCLQQLFEFTGINEWREFTYTVQLQNTGLLVTLATGLAGSLATEWVPSLRR